MIGWSDTTGGIIALICYRPSGPIANRPSIGLGAMVGRLVELQVRPHPLDQLLDVSDFRYIDRNPARQHPDPMPVIYRLAGIHIRSPTAFRNLGRASLGANPSRSRICRLIPDRRPAAALQAFW